MSVFFTVLVLLAALINGASSASYTISSSITTRSLSLRGALALSGVCVWLGAVVMSVLSSRVAQTIYSIVDLSSSPRTALRTLSAGIMAVIIWTVFSLSLSLPTSESHALVSGITGAALGSQMGFDAVNYAHWLIVLLGLFVSVLPAFLLGKLAHRLLTKICSGIERRGAMSYFMRAQRFSAATSSFMHGAQDSQKYMGVYMLGHSLIEGRGVAEEFELTVSTVLIISLTMAAGTVFGGTRALRTVGSRLVRLDASGGAAANMASSLVLAVGSVFGIPVSTTHSKICAMMGVGSRESDGVDRELARRVLLMWCLTFPACALLGYALALIAN